MSDSFDRLLARTERRDTAPAAPCPDADVIAAYLDAALAPSERKALEAHAADCPRCALRLATIVRLEDQSGHPQHAPAPRWRRLIWVVPAATAVLVAAIYVALPVRAPSPASPKQDGAAANRRPEPVAAPPGALASSRRAPEPSVRRQDEAAARASPQAPPASAAATTTPSVPTSEEIGDAVRQRPPLAARETDTLAKTESRARAAQMIAPAAPPADMAAAEPERAPMGANAAGAFVRAPLIVRSPGARVMWRVAGSQIERSTDGGHTWSPEPAPPAAGIMMGAAPSDDVCWLATPTGQVLRRNQAGEWRDVTPSPPRAIARIASSEAAVATVVALDGTVIKTIDGGQHWSPEPPR